RARHGDRAVRDDRGHRGAAGRPARRTVARRGAPRVRVRSALEMPASGAVARACGGGATASIAVLHVGNVAQGLVTLFPHFRPGGPNAPWRFIEITRVA